MKAFVRHAWDAGLLLAAVLLFGTHPQIIYRKADFMTTAHEWKYQSMLDNSKLMLLVFDP